MTSVTFEELKTILAEHKDYLRQVLPHNVLMQAVFTPGTQAHDTVDAILAVLALGLEVKRKRLEAEQRVLTENDMIGTIDR